MKGVAAVCLLCLAMLAGCGGSHRAILYKGISGSLGTKTIVVDDAAAMRDGKSNRAEWFAMIRRTDARGMRFANVPERTFRRRLAAAAAQYGFTVERVEFSNLRQVTPLVVVQTSKYLDFARAVPAIERSLDPHKGQDDSKGWGFRAIYLEALDERGVPFLVVNNVVSRDGITGGQWARSDELFPFTHG